MRHYISLSGSKFTTLFIWPGVPLAPTFDKQWRKNDKTSRFFIKSAASMNNLKQNVPLALPFCPAGPDPTNLLL